MSAYLVNPEHIHVLVAAGLPHLGSIMYWLSNDTTSTPTPANGLQQSGRHRLRTLRTESASAVGQMLVDANTASVNDRYDEANAYIYDYQRPQRSWEPIEICKAIDGYEYQSCEVEGLVSR